MASNAGAVSKGEPVFSPAYNFDSWIEVYNPGDQAVNLGGWYLSDDEQNLKRWQMPSNIGSVKAKGFTTIWLGSNDIKTTQAPFKLDCDGGTIYLSDKEGNLVVSQQYPKGKSRTAWARKTDGGEEWGWTDNATPGESNEGAVFAEERLDAPVVSKGSTLFSNSISVKVNIPEGTTLMYTTDGSLPISMAGFSPWKNVVKNGDCEGTDASNLVSKNGGSTSTVKKITDGAGVNDSRGIKVQAVASATNEEAAQFFVYTPNRTWQKGEKYRFRMKVRADKAATITIKAYRKPGDKIGENMLGGSYNVTTEWTEINYEGTLTAKQAGEKQDWFFTTYTLQAIGFNLNKAKEDNTFYFDDIVWEEYDNSFSSMESTNGQFTFNETTNLTVRLFKEGFLPSVPVTRSYIKTSNKYTLPIVSIVGDQRYFTDPKIGFDCEGDGTNGKTGNGQTTPRNYNQPWDRPVNFSYMSPKGEMLHNQDVNIKVSGGWTRSQQFRSFKLKASKIFDGQNRFDYSFFPQKPYIRNKTLLVRNGGNDVWANDARFMDPALETVIQRSGIDLDVQSYVPIIEYVNGELRGVLNLREPNNDDFAYANWGYDDEELDAFENMVMKNGNDSVLNRIFELAEKATDDTAYNELKTLLDIDEFTNYMAVTMFLDNDDWPNNNMKAYRSQNGGRYRFISFDLDYAFASRNFNKDGDDPFKYFVRFKDADQVYSEGNLNKEIVNLLLNLLGRDEFRRKFIDTFCLVGGSVFEPTRAGKIVDELVGNVKDMCQLMKNIVGWGGVSSGNNVEKTANVIKTKLSGRSKKMANHLKNFSYAKLSTSAQAVTLSADTEGANLYVNGLKVPYADFNGHLFAPVQLRAEAPAGYRFAGWKKGGSIVSTDAEMSLPADNTLSMTATFTPFSEDERQTAGITPVRINEVSAANNIHVNEFFKRNDWVELYNTTSKPVDVEGMYLTDNVSKPKKYQITKGSTTASTVIPAHGYLIVWCDKLEPESQLHAQFKLAAEGGDVMLTASDESWSDRMTYTEHKDDQTVGRYPDGSSQVYVMNVPSIAQANLKSSYVIGVSQTDATGISDLAANNEALTVRYANGRLFICGSAEGGKVQVRVVGLSGQTVATVSASLTTGQAETDLSDLPTAVYIATVTDDHGHKTNLKFVR